MYLQPYSQPSAIQCKSAQDPWAWALHKDKKPKVIRPFKRSEFDICTHRVTEETREANHWVTTTQVNDLEWFVSADNARLIEKGVKSIISAETISYDDLLKEFGDTPEEFGAGE